MDVRLATPLDARGMLDIYASIVRDTAVSFETEPPDEPEMRRRVETTIATYPWLVCERESRLVGYAYASRFRERAAYAWCVEVTCYVDEKERRRGVGRALYGRLLALLREQGFHQAFAVIALPNAASVALHEAMGFRPVGVCRAAGYKLGAWHDVGWWQLTLRQPAGPPLTIRPY